MYELLLACLSVCVQVKKVHVKEGASIGEDDVIIEFET